MSDHMMSVARARRLMDGGHHTVHAGLVMPAARTIVHQAEQITRLQAALRAADGLVLTFSGLPPRADFESDYSLLPGDMENPEVTDEH